MNCNSIFNIALAALSFVGLQSCNSMEEVAVQSIAVSPEEKAVPVGESVQLSVVFTPENATNQKVVWTTDDEAVATVDENGVVTAVAMGETMISALASGFRAQCRVTVPDNTVYVESVSLDETALTMEIGDRQTLVATVTPTDATDPSVKWSSDNTAVATVSEKTGEITAVAGGTANITATAVLAKGTVSASCAVTVVASEYNVLFETFGGTEIQMAVVERDGKLPRPEDPERMIDVPEGLYQGQVDPNDETRLYTFGGWYTDAELQNEYDFDSPVNSSFTLYAKWEGETPQPMDISSAKGTNIVTQTLDYLNGDRTGEYTLVLADNVEILQSDPTPNFNNAGVTLTFVGKGQERTILSSSAGNMFVILHGTFILGENLTFTGSALGSFFCFDVQNDAHLVMLDGAKVANCSGAGQGLIRTQSGDATFTMKGGEICDNTLTVASSGSQQSAPVCVNWGKFIMEGGSIHDNTVSSSHATPRVSGGVYINNWNSMTKTGGEIRDNTASSETGAGSVGQQILYYANPATWKVDNNLEAGDSLTTNEVGTNPLWVQL